MVDTHGIDELEMCNWTWIDSDWDASRSMQLGYEMAKQFKQQAKLLADDMDGHGWKNDTI